MGWPRFLHMHTQAACNIVHMIIWKDRPDTVYTQIVIVSFCTHWQCWCTVNCNNWVWHHHQEIETYIYHCMTILILATTGFGLRDLVYNFTRQRWDNLSTFTAVSTFILLLWYQACRYHKSDCGISHNTADMKVDTRQQKDQTVYMILISQHEMKLSDFLTFSTLLYVHMNITIYRNVHWNPQKCFFVLRHKIVL